jgi:hypothetical protein
VTEASIDFIQYPDIIVPAFWELYPVPGNEAPLFGKNQTAYLQRLA